MNKEDDLCPDCGQDSVWCGCTPKEIMDKVLINNPVKKKRLNIRLHDWHYQCGDACCDLYGTEIYLNGEKCDNQYSGDDVEAALRFVLQKLGYEVDIERTT